LLSKGANVNKKNSYDYIVILLSAFNGHTSTVRCRLNYGAHVEDKYVCRNTPLLLAVLNGHILTVNLLLGNGAKITDMNRDYKTIFDFVVDDVNHWFFALNLWVLYKEVLFCN